MSKYSFCILFIISIAFGCKSDVDREKQAPVPQKSDQAKKILKQDFTTVELTEKVILDEQKDSSILAENKKIEVPKPKKIKAKPVTKPPKPVVMAKAKIVFEHLSHDFGKLVEGEKYTHNYKFKNIGNADLQIKSARASCGCTQPSFPFLEIAPGETGHIGVTYNSVGKEADQTATITVKGNMVQDSVVLFLTGTVVSKEAESDTLSIKKDSLSSVKDSIK